VQLLREYAYANSGIVCLPTLVADAGIRNAGLLVVLPTYQLSTFALNAVYAATSRNAFKLKLFIEHLSAAFSGVAPWDDRMVADGLLPTTLFVD
jgi:DNA-binding transcriptional LysR family regulator